MTLSEVYPGGSVMGIAYNDVMCDSFKGDAWNGKYEYGISKATQPSLGCNVGLVMSELGKNAGSNHFLGCSHTFPPSAIGQIEDHMDGHVPNDGRTDGCWCEKMFYWPGGWPWWWKFPWVYWGPFMPADLPPKELLRRELLPEEPLPEEPMPKKPIDRVPIDPRGPRPTTPPPGEGAGRSGRSRLPERDAAAAVQQGPRVRVGRSSQGQEGRALRRLFRCVRRRP